MSNLAGKRILLAEDEAILAMSMEDLLTDAGCVVVGPAMSLAEAQRLAIDAEIDAAVLDINLGEGDSFGVARLLRGRSVPFCFSTGYGFSGLPPEFTAVPVLQKPYRCEALCALLGELFANPGR